MSQPRRISAVQPAPSWRLANAAARARILPAVVVDFTRCAAAEDDPHGRKRPRHNESVPTLESPAARIFHVHRQHRRAGFLGEKNDPGPEFVGRTARAVRGNDDVPAATRALPPAAKSRSRPCANWIRARRRKPNRWISIRQQIAVPACTDQGPRQAVREQSRLRR